MTSFNSSSVYRGGGPQSGGGVVIISLPNQNFFPLFEDFHDSVASDEIL